MGFRPEGLDEASTYIEDEIAAGSFPGAALVVIRDERTVLERAWGTYCDGQTRDRSYSLETINLFYSFSKPISATVIAMAVERGLVAWDDAVAHYVPEFAQGGKRAITIRHLLTHSAGIPSVPMKEALTEEGWRACVEACCQHDLEWPVGSRSAYHGLSGVLMAAECVRRAAGNATWDEITRAWLFDPLGADSLSFGYPRGDARVALTPQPPDLPAALEPQTYALMGHPAGGCMGLLVDIHRFLWLHLNDGVSNGTRLLQAATVHEMRRNQHAAAIEEARSEGREPAYEPWGLGWLLHDSLDRHWFGFGQFTAPEAFGHAGIDTVLTVVDPRARLTISFLTTTSQSDPEQVTRIRNGVTDRVMRAAG
jgi:CubicO group peptidase (beta-lactamase class C family)